MSDLMNFIHPENMTSEMAVVDNIAHELDRLNNTMVNILMALELISQKLKNHNLD